MPIYDYIYGTVDKSSDTLYENSLKRKEEVPDVVHLTHITTPQSIYHLRLGFPYLASSPETPKWYLCLMWPVTMWTMMFTWIYGRTFVFERHRLDKLRLQTWAISKYNIQVRISIIYISQFCSYCLLQSPLMLGLDRVYFVAVFNAMAKSIY